MCFYLPTYKTVLQGSKKMKEHPMTKEYPAGTIVTPIRLGRELVLGEKYPILLLDTENRPSDAASNFASALTHVELGLGYAIVYDPLEFDSIEQAQEIIDRTWEKVSSS